MRSASACTPPYSNASAETRKLRRLTLRRVATRQLGFYLSRIPPSLVPISEARVNRLAFEREDSEDALVNAAKRLFADKAFQSLDA